MENNNTFNLINQLTEESKSLWRIKNIYINEASNDEEKSFWQKLALQKEEAINTLKKLTKENL